MAKIKISSKFLLIVASLFIMACVTITLVVVLYRPRTSVLKIYNWEDYIDEDLIKEFQSYYREQTGDKKFKVKYATFTDNEELLSKLEVQSKDYDIAFPSEYMVEKLMEKELLKPIDTSKIANYSTDNLDSSLTTKVENYAKNDNGLYAIPYIYGTLGIMYDVAEIDAADLTAFENALSNYGWGVLFGDLGDNEETNTAWQEKYRGRITMKKSARDTIGAAMLYSHYDSIYSSTTAGNVINMIAPYTLEDAKTALNDQITKMKPTYENDEGKSLFADPDNNDFAFGLYWSCDAGLIMADNPDIRYYTPTYTNFWIDNFVLPTNGTQSDETTAAAYAFINFMLEKQNAVKNMTYLGSESAIKDGKTEYLAYIQKLKDDGDIDSGEYEQLSNENYVATIFPDSSIMSNGAVMKNFDTAEKETAVNDLMLDVMNRAASLDEGNNLLWLWIVLGILAACGIAYLTYFLLTRRRRQSV
ncbi:MAG: extracellular solute-binding protein [Christensenellaceae bacterium]|jgi:spermidine/putrescine transport system substrate-binding protein|nr:extracellular solute-binding protein [Christensenellaceae bacterium]